MLQLGRLKGFSLPTSYVSKFRKDEGDKPFVYAVNRRPSLEEIKGMRIEDIFIDQDGACIIILNEVEMEACNEQDNTTSGLRINGIFAEDLDQVIDDSPRSVYDPRVWDSGII